jgi:hypothetical protein
MRKVESSFELNWDLVPLVTREGRKGERCQRLNRRCMQRRSELERPESGSQTWKCLRNRVESSRTRVRSTFFFFHSATYAPRSPFFYSLNRCGVRSLGPRQRWRQAAAAPSKYPKGRVDVSFKPYRNHASLTHAVSRTLIGAMSKQYTPTPEHLALAAERRAKRQNKVETSSRKNDDSGNILLREWMQLQAPHINAIKVMTWNVCSFSTRARYTPT